MARMARKGIFLRLFLIFLLGYALSFWACGGGGGGGDSSQGQPQTQTPTPSQPQTTQEQIGIFATSPTSETSFTSNTNPVTISGKGGGAIASIQWKNITTGQSGPATGTESWSLQVPLQSGDNQIEVTASSSSGAEKSTMPLTVTYNTAVSFTSLPAVTPDAGFVGQTYSSVYVRVAIDGTNLDPASVQLYKVDDGGNKAQLLKTMTDDGKMDNGDEIQGDGVYSAKISLASSTVDLIGMRIYAKDKQGKESVTSMGYFVFLDPSTDSNLSRQATVNNLALSKYENLIQQKKAAGLSDQDAALQSLDALVAYVAGLDGVLMAEKSDASIWWVDEQGLTYVIDTSDYYGDELFAGSQSAGERGLIPVEKAGIDWERFNAPSTRLEYLKTGAPAVQAERLDILKAVEEKYKVGSLDAIHLAPYKGINTIHTATSGWATVIKDCECLNNKVPYINNASDPVMISGAMPDLLNAWKELNKYGLISLMTHGGNVQGMKTKLAELMEKWVDKNFTAYKQKFPTKTDADLRAWMRKYFVKRVVLIQSWIGNAREFFLSNIGMGGSVDDQKAYINDPQYESLRTAIHQNRIILLLKRNKADQKFYYMILITPEFIAYHNKGDFPKSIWIAAACRSASTYSMADMFRSKGGLTYIGYSQPVKGSYAVATQRTIFDSLVNKGMNAQEAIDAARAAHGTNDGSSTPADLRGKGEGQARVVFELKNPLFENPDGKGSLEGWKTEGDARAIKTLGGASPTQGGTMAVISTGLGLTTSYGKLSQTLCLDQKVKDLIFDWNFFSEEFKEYCNKGFDDTFLVTVTDKTTGVEKQLFRTSVNTLCGACNGNDLNSAACQNLPLNKSSVSFDRGDVWDTGWNSNQTASLMDYAGKAVVLKFFIEDKGDTVYDTVVLIDNIRVTTE